MYKLLIYLTFFKPVSKKIQDDYVEYNNRL